jgi:hypothetical protein
MWAWIELNRHKTKLSGGLLYRGGSYTTYLKQDCSWCSMTRKAQILHGVLYFSNVLRFNISHRHGDKFIGSPE